MNDKHKYLTALLRGVQQGYKLPSIVSKDTYQFVKENKDIDPVLTGFIGFGCSYSGKWFGGYAHNKTGRNYAREAKESLLRDMSTLMDAEILCKDYREVELPEGCVIYADPPYNNTTGYNNEKFDSEAFWDYARRTSQDHLMFISEQIAPDDFIPIWERQVTRTVDINKQNYFKATEKLFIHKCNTKE